MKRLYDMLPQTPGGNRYDRTWKMGSAELRFYVGEMHRREATWNLALFSPRFQANISLGGGRWQDEYVGPQPSTRESCDDRKNWKAPSSYYFRWPDKYGWIRWRIHHLSGKGRNLSEWALYFYNGRIDADCRLYGKK